MVVLVPVGPSCLPIVLRGLIMNRHGSRVFLYSVPPSRLSRIFSATLRGTTPVFLMFCRYSIVRGNSHPWSISFLVDFSGAAEFSSEWDYLWFPLIIIASKSDFSVSYLIGSRW